MDAGVTTASNGETISQKKSPEEMQAELDRQIRENRKLSRQLQSLQDLMERTRAHTDVSVELSSAALMEQANRDKFLKLLLENSPDIILMFDKYNRFAYCTDVFLKRARIPNFSVIGGRTFAEVFVPFLEPGELDEMVLAFRNAIRDRQNVTVDKIIDFSKGENPRNYTIHFSPMVDNNGNMEGAIMLFHDLTDIREAMEAAKQANKAKSAFLANTSHEIRTPMNAIVGMAELILRENISQTIYGYVMNIKQASTNLLAIINDILDFSKIESGKMDIITGDYQLSSLLNDVISVIRIKVLEKPIQILTYIDGTIPNNLKGDVIRIRQILMNLLSNAVKYTERGFITLTVKGIMLNEGVVNLVISVTDTGIGIKEADIPKLFGNFVQVDTTKNRSIEGTGLGLAISKNLCVLMGGDIFFSSVYGEGSTFTMEIPQEVTGNAVIAQVEAPETKSVLLYEIHKENAESMLQAFANLGVSCNWVSLQSKFYEALLERIYPYIFVSYVALEGVLQVVEKMQINSKIVVMAEYGTQISVPKVRMIPLPVHSMTIANVLNNIADYSNFREDSNAIRFIAPEARILIVDDINTNLIVARGLMLPFKMHIDICKSGREAIDMVAKNRYDIVFMDHMMPEMDGIEATSIIRARQGEDNYFQKVPIVALTANAVSGMKEMFMKNGMNDFLAKPIETVKLNKILDKWIPPEKKQTYIEDSDVEELLPDTGEETAEQDVLVIEGIDVQTGISMTGGTPEYYLESLKSYFNDGKEKIREIRTALEKGDLPLYTTYVHAMKSASASIGATALSVAAKELEAAGKNRDEAFIGANNEVFLRNLEDCLGKIGAALEARNIGEVEPVEGGDPGLIRGELEELREALDNMDMQKYDQMIRSLLARKWEKELAGKLQNISQNILFSNFDEAIELIDELLKNDR
ncbi:MAG: response regulator [Spirochaetaceae bacterium]|jgi:signal transduction histidine kinase/CheY-like chemotaxis protein|nr:response regulator [Spirochaetaceae bacterium]